MPVPEWVFGGWALGLASGEAAVCGGDVGEQIPREAEDLHDEDAAQGDNGSVFGHLGKIFHVNAEEGGVFASVWWDVVVVLGEVIGVDMVAAVG